MPESRYKEAGFAAAKNGFFYILGIKPLIYQKVTRKSPSAITLKCDFQWLGKCFILSYTMKNLTLIVFSIISLFCILSNAYCEETANQQQAESKAKYVGKFFEIQVPIENYYFIKGVLAVFGNKYGPQPQKADEEEAVIWDQLLLDRKSVV